MQFSYCNRFNWIRIIFLYLCLFTILLTSSNISYALDEKRLVVGFSIYSPPVFVIQDDDFSIQGISVEIARMLADNMGWTIQFYAMDDFDYSQSLEQGIIDCFIGIKNDIENPETINMIETEITIDRHIFINNKCVDFTSLKDLPGHTVIIRDGDFASGFLTSRHDISFIISKTEQEELDLLNSGKAQIYISHSQFLNMDDIKNYGLLNITEIGDPIKGAPLVIATSKKNFELNNSLQKAYEMTRSSFKYRQMLMFWKNRETDVLNTRGKNIYYFLMASFKYIKIAVGVIIFAFSGIIFWNNMLKRKVNRIKKDLYMSEQRYKDLIESSPDMILLVLSDGKVRMSNNIALNCLGYNENEMELLKLQDLVSAEEIEKVTVLLDRASKTKYSKTEITLLPKSGAGICVEMAATVVKSNDENLICTFSRDLTERKYLEEKLIHSDRLAIMGHMAAGIAHEINNPLGIILSNTGDLISGGPYSEDDHESLKSIERNALRAAKITQDLLSFTRPTPLKKVMIDLIPLIDECLLFLKHKIKAKDVGIEKIYSDPSIFFLCDEKLMQQLLINVILNAIQAVNHKGRITLAVSLRNELKNTVLLIEISDNGVGIPKEDILKIFNPFYTSRKTGGFGLGLYLSKMIVDKHDGIIFVTSELSKGTTVTVKIPSEGILPSNGV